MKWEEAKLQPCDRMPCLQLSCYLILLHFPQLSAEAVQLSMRNKRLTVTAREVQTAARLVLPGELAKHAVSEGVKAVEKYNKSAKQ